MRPSPIRKGIPESPENQARIWGISATIERKKKNYWDQLEQAQRGSLDLTPWLLYAINVVADALRESTTCVERVMQVTWFWLRNWDATKTGYRLHNVHSESCCLARPGDYGSHGSQADCRHP